MSIENEIPGLLDTIEFDLYEQPCSVKHLLFDNGDHILFVGTAIST